MKRVSCWLNGCLVIMLMVSLVGAACAKPQATIPQATRAGWPEEISIGSPGVTTAIHPALVGWADLLGKQANIKASAEASGGSGASVALIKAGEIEIAFCSGDVAYEAVRGIGDYSGKAVSLRLIGVGHTMRSGIFTKASSGIKTVADFRGRSYNYRQLGSPVNIRFGDYLLEAYGLSREVVKTQTNTGSADVVKAVVDGTADVGSTWAYKAAPAVQMALTTDIYFVPLSKEAQDYLHKKYPPFMPSVVEKGAYRGVDEDVPAMSMRTWYVVRPDLPEDLIYEVTKVFYENLGVLAGMSAVVKEITVEASVMNPPVAYHAGAIKYLKEKGVWSAEMDKLQKQLLEEMATAK